MITLIKQRIRIAEEVYLTCIPTEKFKSGWLTMHFITPLSEGTAAQRALVPRVLRRGCAAYPTISDITKQLQTLYNASLSSGGVSKLGETQIITQTAWMLENCVVPDGTDVLGGVLSLFRDVWFSPLLREGAFDGAYIAGEKRSLADAIRAKINNKNAYAAMRCAQEMCRGERYAVSENGTEKTVAAASPRSVFAAYNGLLRSMPCEIYYVGRSPAEPIAEALRRAFADVKRSAFVHTATDVVRRAPSVREVTEEQPTAQAKLSLGFRMGACEADGKLPQMLLFNELFGASPTAKLFMNVREKLSLCYYCSSRIENLKGTMLVSCGIENEKKQAAQDEILAQLADIREGRITDAEMDAAKKSLRCAFMQLGDDPASMARWDFGRRLSGRTDATPEDDLAAIEALGRDDIAALARDITLDTVYFMRAAGDAADTDEEDENEDE